MKSMKEMIEEFDKERRGMKVYVLFGRYSGETEMLGIYYSKEKAENEGLWYEEDECDNFKEVWKTWVQEWEVE